MAGDSTARFLEFAVDGDADALEVMIESQAVPVDVVESGSGGVTALCIAASRGHARAVKTLLRRGASPHKQHAKADPTGNTPLHFAAMGGSVEVLALLTVFSVRVVHISNLTEPRST
jgi:ankyrin repeat protein